MKKFVVHFVSLVLVLLLCISFASATSYEYVIDNSNLFDDSTDMISMSKEIRNKLDFDIHIYSVSTMEDTEEIINQYVQEASVLLIFISEDEEMSWYAGSSVQHTIRDIDFENLFSHVSVSNKQYTKAVNFILSKILSIYVYGDETIDDYAITSEPSNIENESWLMLNLHYWINFIRQHPVRIFIILIFITICLIYYYDRSRKRNSEKEE